MNMHGHLLISGTLPPNDAFWMGDINYTATREICLYEIFDKPYHAGINCLNNNADRTTYAWSIATI